MSKTSNRIDFSIAGNGVSFLKHEVRWVFSFVKRTAAITPDPCDGDHDCLVNINNSKSYWAYIYVNESLPVVSCNLDRLKYCEINLIDLICCPLTVGWIYALGIEERKYEKSHLL